MADVQLIINDESLDLKDKEKIAITLQSQNFSKLSEKSGGFSRSFVVPRTDKNMRLLQYSMVFNSNSKIPYKKISCILKNNGVELASGNIIIENDGISENEIRLTFYTGNSPFFQIIKEYNLIDITIPYNEHIHYSSLIQSKNIPFPYTGWGTRTLFYPIVDNSVTDTYFTSTADYVPIDRLLPAILWNTIKPCVEEYIGYTLNGELFSSEIWNQLFYIASESFIRNNKYNIRNSWSKQVGTPYLQIEKFPNDFLLNGGTDYVELRTTPSIIRYWEVFNDVLPLTMTNSPYHYKGGWKFAFSDRVRIKLKIEFELLVSTTAPIGFCIVQKSNPFSGTQVADCKTWFTNDPNTSNIVYPNHAINATGVATNGINTYNFFLGTLNYFADFFTCFRVNPIQSSATPYNVTLEFEMDVDPHIDINFQTIGSNSHTFPYQYRNINTQCTFIKDNGTSKSDRQVQLLDLELHNPSTTPQQDLQLYSYSILNNETPLPDIKISEWIKDICYLFNAIIIIDDDKKTVNFFTLKELYENIPNSLDWSNKLINKLNSKWNTRAQGFARNTNLIYDNSKTEYNIISNKTINVDDETIPDSIDFIKLRYEASPMRNTFSVFPAIAKTNLIDDGVFKSGKQKILLLNYLDAPSNQVPPYRLIFLMPNSLGTYTRNRRFAFGYFNIEGVFPYNTTQAELGFGKKIYNDYYKYCEYFLNEYKQLFVELILEPTDINKIDFSIPIYLQQYNSYFFIEKIDDWIAGKPCKVQLLKLN